VSEQHRMVRAGAEMRNQAKLAAPRVRRETRSSTPPAAAGKASRTKPAWNLAQRARRTYQRAGIGDSKRKSLLKDPEPDL
jgi:hypothetical protein